MAVNEAVYELPGTASKDCYIRGIFPVERRAVPWHSQPIAILEKKVKRTDRPIMGNLKVEQITYAQQSAKDKDIGMSGKRFKAY